jgi:DNA-binding NtrC family response regulator
MISPDDFDLVITDQTMPKKAGVELAKELLKIRPNIAILICRGYSAKVTDGEALGICIYSFCQKPITIKQLATVTREALGTS